MAGQLQREVMDSYELIKTELKSKVKDKPPEEGLSLSKKKKKP